MIDFTVEIIDGYFVLEGRSFKSRVFTDLGEIQTFISELLEEMQKDEPNDNKSDDPADQEKE